MLIRARMTFAGPEAAASAGQVLEVSQALADTLIEAGAAEVFAPRAPKKPEAAAAGSKVESAKAGSADVETGKAPEGGQLAGKPPAKRAKPK